MSRTLAIRLPELEWSYQAGTGALKGVRWVDVSFSDGRPGLRQVSNGSDEPRFRGRRHLGTLPHAVGAAALDAQRRGQPTAWEGLALLLGRVEWLVAARRHLWAPHSPVPSLLASLVEAYGVEPAVHAHEPSRLARLTALLPVWHPHRGTVARAREVLATCDQEQALAQALSSADPKKDLTKALRHEVFQCHASMWWRYRRSGHAVQHLRIDGGYLRFQPPKGVGWELRREDVLMNWDARQPLPRAALRLLPAWTCIRLTKPSERKTR